MQKLVITTLAILFGLQCIRIKMLQDELQALRIEMRQEFEATDLTIEGLMKWNAKHLIR